jgi:hypothetical protein
VPGEPRVPAAELAEVFGPGVERADVTVESLYEPVASASAGIWRLRAAGRSLVLKLVSHADGGHENWRSGLEPTHWYYWRREALAYQTGLLESLPGATEASRLRAPRCHAVVERGDGSVALWLEDLGDASASRWGLPRYELAARHFGRMQGRYLDATALPNDEWLSRNWLRTYLSQRDGDMDMLDDTSAWRDALIARWFPDPPIAAAKAMRRDQPIFTGVLEQLPTTLCHLDLHPANLFSDHDDATVAIDWSFVGLGAIGEDVGNLVADAVLDFHVPAEQLDALHDAVGAGYEAGLRDAGWDGSPQVVRLAMAATMAAKYAWILPAALRAVAEDRRLLNGRPLVESLRWWAPTVRFLLARADEARRLAEHP